MSLRKFEILEMIAKGGMAEVYRARTVGPEGFAKELCVKKILPHLTEDQNFVTMFVNEAKLAATLGYANIVSVHDLCVSADREYFIVMEYVHGKDLSDVIRAAQLAGKEVPPDIAVYVAREVAKGLYYAHTRRDPDGAPLHIIHRDISPQNVLCSFMGEVKITDFGIAKAASVNNKTAVGILKGKYGYMSPEQARGLPLDHRSDIFNLGIVLYEMLVGERCFAGASDYSTLNLMREAVVTPPSRINKQVPKALEEIVLKALSKKPEDRYQDCLELEGALADYARSNGAERGATDLNRFLGQLFSGQTRDDKGRSTGVLDLSSVVGPAPVAPEEARKRSAPRGPTPLATGTDGPSSAPPPAPPVAAEKPPRPERPPKPEKPARPPKAAEPEASPAEAAPAASEASKPARAAGAEAPADKPERRPARIKPAAEAPPKNDKAAAKEAARAARKPVGRRDLKPGLTDVSALDSSGRRRRWATIGGVLVGAAVLGALLGVARARSSGEQSVFRQMELASRGPTPEGESAAMVSVLIETKPPGASVWLDGNRLAETTPVSVRRERDANEHSIELSLKGHRSLQTRFRLDPGPLTISRSSLVPETGELKVRSKPSNLPVLVDGLEVGRTPVTAQVPWGRREVTIGGEDTERLVVTAEVEAGGTTTVDRAVPARGRRTTIAVLSDPPASLSIDGVDAGHWTGPEPIDVEPGVPHKITLRDGQGQPLRELDLQLEAGERRRLFVALEP